MEVGVSLALSPTAIVLLSVGAVVTVVVVSTFISPREQWLTDGVVVLLSYP
jgi:hypothetical protein